MASSLTRVFARLIFDTIFGKPRRKRSSRKRRIPQLTAEQVQSIGNRYAIATARMPPGWGLLPEWKGPPTWRYTATTSPFDVDLKNYACPCAEWQESRASLPAGHIHRCCRHVAEAMWRHPEITAEWPNFWTRRVAEGLTDWAIPVHFEQALFSNGIEDFLCLYNTARGYIQAFPASGGPHYGLSIKADAHRDRWGHNSRPKACVALKKAMRPWVVAMHAKHGNARTLVT